MNTTERQRQRQIEIDMTRLMRELLGRGYVDDYYRDMANDFINAAQDHARDSYAAGISARGIEVADEGGSASSPTEPTQSPVAS